MNTTYHGINITSQPGSRLVCPFFVGVPIRRHARDLAHAQQIVDAYLAAQASRPAGPRIVSFEAVKNTNKKPGRYRDAQDRARAQQGKAGRFEARL